MVVSVETMIRNIHQIQEIVTSGMIHFLERLNYAARGWKPTPPHPHTMYVRVADAEPSERALVTTSMAAVISELLDWDINAHIHYVGPFSQAIAGFVKMAAMADEYDPEIMQTTAPLVFDASMTRVYCHAQTDQIELKLKTDSGKEQRHIVFLDSVVHNEDQIKWWADKACENVLLIIHIGDDPFPSRGQYDTGIQYFQVNPKKQSHSVQEFWYDPWGGPSNAPALKPGVLQTPNAHVTIVASGGDCDAGVELMVPRMTAPDPSTESVP